MNFAGVLLLLACFQDPVPVPVPVPLTAYVSAAGDDTTGTAGNDAMPFRTVTTAAKVVGVTSILLKRGEEYPGPIPIKSGLMVGAYGEGPRPLIVLPASATSYQSRDPLVDWKVSDLDFYCRAADPAAYGATPPTNYALMTLRPVADVAYRGTFENCRWRFVIISCERPTANMDDLVTFRRCVVLDTYPIPGKGHMQGMYGAHMRLLLDGCVFDHCGWSATIPGSGATAFNHNVYLTECSGTVIRNCTSARPSSIGFKLTANATDATHYILLDDNLLLGCEIGIEASGNVFVPDRFINPVIQNNLLYELGRDPQPGRPIAWGIRCRGWLGGRCDSNVMLQSVFQGGNTWFLNMSEMNALESVTNNFCLGVNSAVPPTPSGMVWSNNRVQFDGQYATLPLSIMQAGSLKTPVFAAGVVTGDVVQPTPQFPADVLPLPWDEFILRIREQGQSGPWDESLDAETINAKVRKKLGVRKAA